MIADKKRKMTMKQIAEHFEISEMQLYRIKSGENWGHVK
jgi:DNA-directed RNA polymerase specialized sigma subunit